MKVLFDQGVPAPLRKALSLEVGTCYEMGWSAFSNGDLLVKAEEEYDIFVTTDKNLRYQQHIAGRKIAIFVLPTTRWPSLHKHETKIASAIEALALGDYLEWQLPE